MYRGRTFQRETVYYTGEFLDGEMYPVFQTPGKRRKKCRPTSEIQERINQRNAEKKVQRILRLNFSAGDVTLTLTYRPGEEPEDAEQARRDAQNFAKRLKRLYRKMGLELRYLYATECGKSGRWHHHFVLTGGVDRDAIEKAWGKGYANSKRLQLEEDGLAGLSKYIVKERRYYKRWSGSRNLEQPEPVQLDGQLSMFDAEEAADAIESGREHAWFEKKYPGYELIEARCERNNINRGVYIWFEMRRIGRENGLPRRCAPRNDAGVEGTEKYRSSRGGGRL